MKWDILKKGLELNVPYEMSWSCYEGGTRPCGKCGTCVERVESFYRNNVSDPAMTENEWQEAVKFMKETCKIGA